MLTPQEIESLLFIDIETVPMAQHWEDLSPEMQSHWSHKHHTLQKRNQNQLEDESSASNSFFLQSGVYAEFAKVVCISCGYLRFKGEGEAPEARIKTLFNVVESDLLTAFKQLILHFAKSRNGNGAFKFCGHNIKEFDLPFLTRRMIINQVLPLPNVLDTYGKKPWEVEHVDTMQYWRFGDNKSYTSLDLLAATLGLGTSKGELNGSKVATTFWHEQNYDLIQSYCQADVLITMKVLLRFMGYPTDITFQPKEQE
jgi:3'-5' exonuclease